MRQVFQNFRIETADKSGMSLLVKARLRRLRALQVREETEANLFV